MKRERERDKIIQNIEIDLDSSGSKNWKHYKSTAFLNLCQYMLDQTNTPLMSLFCLKGGKRLLSLIK